MSSFKNDVTNKAIFLNFLNRKNFENIFDFPFNRDLKRFLSYSLVKLPEYDYGIIVHPNEPDNENNYLPIQLGGIWQTPMRLYKELEQDNTMFACSYLALSPFFLSVNDILEYLEEKKNYDNRYFILKLVNKIMINMSTVVRQSIREKLARYCQIFYSKKHQTYRVKSLSMKEINQVLEDIGINGEHVIYDPYESKHTCRLIFHNKSLPTYRIVWMKQRISNNIIYHMELPFEKDELHFIRMYRLRDFDWDEFDDMSIDDDDPELNHPDPIDYATTDDEDLEEDIGMDSKQFVTKKQVKKKIRKAMRRVRRGMRRNNNRRNRQVRNINVTPVIRGINNRYISNNPIKEFNMYKKQLYQYFQSLLNPELSTNGGPVPKQPNYITIPTSSITFKEQINIKLYSESKFYAIWVPNFLSTKESLIKHMPPNELRPYPFYSHFYYTLDKGANWQFHTSYLPEIKLSKYRLVSAKCSLQYNGSKYYKGGQFHSSAIYNDVPVFVGITQRSTEEVGTISINDLTNMGSPDLSALCDIELVKNGLWNKYINISGRGSRLDNLAFPTDPTDHTFYPLTHYYSVEPTSKENSNVFYKCANSTDGGHLSYILSAQNINLGDDGLTNITIVIYYNFEIIADQSTAAFLRAKDGKEDNVFMRIVEKAKPVIEEVVQEVQKKPSINPKSTWQVIKPYLQGFQIYAREDL